MFRTLLKAITFATLTATLASAEDLPVPQGDVILTISGNVECVNVDKTAQFDLALLEGMDATTFETTTIWTKGKQVFQGVSLKLLVEALGLEGTKLNASAINDYTVEIPMSDAVEGGAIVAYRLNDKTMSVREKGPLWIVYPYDSNDTYRSEVTYSRSIWQLDRIEVLD